MNERENVCFQKILASKSARAIAPEVVARVFQDACLRFRETKDIEDWTKRKLHQMTGAFMTEKELRSARGCLAEYVAGDPSALDRALSTHASTRERANARELYERVFDRIGVPRRTLDFACGLNPLILGELGCAVRGIDMHTGAVALVNDWARAAGWDVECVAGDVCALRAYDACDLALFMKLLPLLELQARNGAQALLKRVPARHMLLTFSTRTLGGRDVGMDARNAQWLETHTPSGYHINDTWTQDAERVWLLSEDT